MEALKAAALTPVSVLSKRAEPRKSSAVAPPSPFRKNCRISFSGALQRSLGLALLSPIAISELAGALTYEEALQQSVTSGDLDSLPDFDVGGVLDGFLSFAAENPLIIGGSAAILAAPLVISRLIGKPKAWGSVTAKAAYAKLGDDPDAELLDIRAPAEIRQSGRPDVRGLKKKPAAVAYEREDKSGFLNKLLLRFKKPEDTTLYVMDRFDGNSELIAELVTKNGFKAAYAIKDGAEGPRGWLNSGLPWILPKKAFSFDLSSLSDAIGDTLGVVDAVPVALGAAAAAALGVLTYTEVEPILQTLGSIAIVQFVSRNLLSEEGRIQTARRIKEFVSDEIAPIELLDDIQQIGKALLPSFSSGKSLPSTAEAAPAVVSDQPKVEATLELNSVPQAQESLPGLSRPLSPYPNYPDYKPPASPMPSQP